MRRVSTDPDKRIPVHNMNIGIEREIGYPSAWFDANPNKKPAIKLMPVEENQRASIQAAVRAGFDNGTLDHRIALRFLFDEFNRKEGILNSDWTSFDRNIGLTGNRITLRHLIDFEYDEEAPPLVASGPIMGDGEVLKYIIAICSIYRLAQVTREDYKAQILNNVQNLMAPLGDPELDVGNALLTLKRWLGYQPYVKMMAVIDMFLNEFPYHTYAQARIGTIVTRFKDCSTLISTAHITKSLGLTFEEFAEWIWTKKCADQFMQIIKGGEEVDNPRSYAMYFMDLGLSVKSPYSASVNPDLHFFYHVIGCCSGIVRSRNARMVGQPEILNILANAVVLHGVMGNFATMGQQFNPTGIPVELDESEQDPIDIIAEDDMPQEKDSSLWLGYVMGKHGRIPQKIIKRAAREWREHADTREETVGRFLYERSASMVIDE
nr:MAG: nucleocapsid protein [Adumi ohlsrhavirus]